MDRRIQQLLRQCANDPSAIVALRRAYRQARVDLPDHLVAAYVNYKYADLYPKLVSFIEHLLNIATITPERLLGDDCIDGLYYYEGWTGEFRTNQPLIDRRRNLFQWALPLADSTEPEIIYTRDFEGGEAFGDVALLCEELRANIIEHTGCPQWEVRWSHGMLVEPNYADFDYEEEVMPRGPEVYSNTHYFFIWITHPMNQHLLDDIDSYQ